MELHAFSSKSSYIKYPQVTCNNTLSFYSQAITNHLIQPFSVERVDLGLYLDIPEGFLLTIYPMTFGCDSLMASMPSIFNSGYETDYYVNFINTSLDNLHILVGSVPLAEGMISNMFNGELIELSSVTLSD